MFIRVISASHRLTLWIGYVDVNPESENTIIMVHGWPGLWSNWFHQIEEFKVCDILRTPVCRPSTCMSECPPRAVSLRSLYFCAVHKSFSEESSDCITDNTDGWSHHSHHTYALSPERLPHHRSQPPRVRRIDTSIWTPSTEYLGRPCIRHSLCT